MVRAKRSLSRMGIIPKIEEEVEPDRDMTLKTMHGVLDDGNTSNLDSNRS
jgi:hypothetical protein